MEEKKNHSNDPNATQPIDEQGRYAEKSDSAKYEESQETLCNQLEY